MVRGGNWLYVGAQLQGTWFSLPLYLDSGFRTHLLSHRGGAESPL